MPAVTAGVRCDDVAWSTPAEKHEAVETSDASRMKLATWVHCIEKRGRVCVGLRNWIASARSHSAIRHHCGERRCSFSAPFAATKRHLDGDVARWVAGACLRIFSRGGGWVARRAVFMRDALSDDAAATPSSALLGRGARALISSQPASSGASGPPTTLLIIHNMRSMIHYTLPAMKCNKSCGSNPIIVQCPRCLPAPHTRSRCTNSMRRASPSLRSPSMLPHPLPQQFAQLANGSAMQQQQRHQ